MVIVIGASSFIGVYTVNALQKAGIRVFCTGRSKKFQQYYQARSVPYVPLDLTNESDFSVLPTEEVEGVILLAGLLPANTTADLKQEENAADYFLVNTVGTIRVLEFCRKNHLKRVISTTSYADVFSSWEKQTPITEETPRGFLYTGDHAAYVISKNAAADIMEYYNQQHGMSNAVFRLPPVYGAGPHGSLFVNGVCQKSGLQVFIEKAQKGEDIPVYGDKDVSRDVVYVKDVANAFSLAVRSSRTYGLYNISAGRGVTLEEQARAAARVFAGESGQSKIVFHPEQPNRSRSFVMDIDKAKNDFGYEPHFADFTAMMLDYKKEMEAGDIGRLFS